MAKMTPKQQLFVQEYLIDLNATQAAIRAGYSPISARQIADENMSKPDIQNAIAKAMAERSKRTGINQDMVIEELKRIAFADLKDFLSYKTIKRIVGYDPVDRTPIIEHLPIIELLDSDGVDGNVIQEVSLSSKGCLTFKLHDKMAALDKLGKHLGMFKDKIEVSGQLSKNTTNLTDEQLDEEIKRLEQKLSSFKH